MQKGVLNMKQTIFTGAAVAVITPMLPDGSVHYKKLDEILEQQIAGGTDAVVICGTTGEAPTLDDEEHLECIGHTVRTVAGRIPVIAGTGSNNTEHAIMMSREAKALGADAVLLVTPYYNKTSQVGLVRHFTAIADTLEIPAILYNVPSRTGVNIGPGAAKALCSHPMIRGLKEASGNIGQVAEIAALCGDELPIYSGNDDQIVPLLALGGKGVISVLSNVAPRQTHDICQLWFEGKTQESLALQLKYLPLVKALFSDVSPMPVKAAMNLMGMEVGSCRLPLTTLDEGQIEKIREALAGAGLL